ncbi:MAG TPA: SgcJ/EcaC family oxidoreductase [Thermoleophilaceae bacterium]|nr:SgcJ/EcaC family oxidoreductase [Thermoleophilaceae bacterium]
MTTTSPEHTVERVSRLLADGDLDALVALYEPDAAFAPEPGRCVQGLDEIREALRPFVATRPRMSGAVEKVLTAGDTALVAYRWTLEGTGPDGSLIRTGGTSADVLRRRPDGSWGVLIDDPYGALAGAA